MSKTINVSYEGRPCYEIALEEDFDAIITKLKQAGCNPSQKVCIVTDSNLAELHLTKLEQKLKTFFNHIISYIFPAGEENKNLKTVQKVYEALIFNHFDRHDLLIAFGGGVVGDLTGFTAATFLRGIDFIQIPTSLLSQVDSSIGGKTGVDFSRYKNMVGAFYQPKLVYMNISLLRSLPLEQYLSGMAEILKHGLIKDKSYFRWIQIHCEEIMMFNIPVVEEMIYRSCQIKREIVERDPKEQGERALLNFGHTIGHAVEKLADFSLYHGQCVGIGMAAACYISLTLGHISTEEYEDIISTLKLFGIPVKARKLKEDEILSTSKSDKKMLAGKIKFVLLSSVGNAYVNSDLTQEQIRAGIASIL
ncbi:MAG: 3-dehydroquinate synthase [Lachnospiraceae bacterium]|nr:3-dehydroquinate synthase [Lachnospiraceae bacterium]MDE6982791.1 3-dehydroquinate synthase [Lachnospiraceae bacterium]